LRENFLPHSPMKEATTELGAKVRNQNCAAINRLLAYANDDARTHANDLHRDTHARWHKSATHAHTHAHCKLTVVTHVPWSSM